MARGKAPGKARLTKEKAVPAQEISKLRHQLAEAKRELVEERAQRAASAEILRSIASTPQQAQRALDDICETALRLFGASSVGIRRVEGNVLRAVASAGAGASAVNVALPDVQLDQSTPAAQAVLQRRQIHRDDMTHPIGADEFVLSQSQPWQIAVAAGVRSTSLTPLMREGEAIGVLLVFRNEVRPFTENELALQRGFADQAVIAIENARLLDELRKSSGELQESLEYQIAASDVLNVISRSPSQIQRVLDTIAETAQRLCRPGGDRDRERAAPG